MSKALPRRQIAICGNGAGAAALVYALARKLEEPTSVCVIGDGGMLGEGLAYATRNPVHVLNVGAARMSIDPDLPGHFTGWLKRNAIRCADWSEQFRPRLEYGQYLREVVAEAAAANPNLELVSERSHIIGLVRRENGWTVSFRSGAINADIVVLATGNDMPTPIGPGHSPGVAASIIDNPWTPLAIGAGEDVLIRGTALTAVDTMLSLIGNGHRGRISLLSRRGLLPHVHVRCEPASPLAPPWPRTVRGLLNAMRRAVGRRPQPEQWQAFMDAMRPHWSAIWQGFPVAERRRFLRHGAAIWNVHRHRVAPSVGAGIDALLGRHVQKIQGRIAEISRTRHGRLAVRIEGRDGSRLIEADRIINCSGPNADPEKTNDRLIENIIASRYARSGVASIGIDVDGENRVVDHNGEAQRSLFAMGSLTRGRWWEITAMPEIALQAGQLAQTIIAQLHILERAGHPGAESLPANAAALP